MISIYIEYKKIQKFWPMKLNNIWSSSVNLYPHPILISFNLSLRALVGFKQKNRRHRYEFLHKKHFTSLNDKGMVWQVLILCFQHVFLFMFVMLHNITTNIKYFLNHQFWGIPTRKDILRIPEIKLRILLYFSITFVFCSCTIVLSLKT